MKTKEMVKALPSHGEEGHFCHGGCAGYAEGGEVMDQSIPPEAESSEPGDMPDHIREMVEDAHKEKRESRPDEGWHIQPAAPPESVAPYKKNEEEQEKKPDIMDQLSGLSMGGSVPGYDDGGQVPSFDVSGGDSDTTKLNGLTPGAVPPAAPPAIPAPIDMKSIPPASAPLSPDIAKAATAITPAAVPSAPGLSDEDYMTRANKMLGLGPDQQAGLMKLLGNNAQKGQIGAAVAGIGDAIASGGTLGKVNPGALAKSEDLIQGKTKEGIEGMQTIRGNQEKAQELSDKLEARDPKSPLSKYAQKAYAGVGKKLGLDLSNASAALIADVTGKGVETLNTEYQNELKMMGLDLQKQQVGATIKNQEAERRQAEETRSADAAKTLAGQGLIRKGLNQLTPTGRAAQDLLQKQATGQGGTNGPIAVNSKAEYDALPSGTHYVDSFGTQKVKK